MLARHRAIVLSADYDLGALAAELRRLNVGIEWFPRAVSGVAGSSSSPWRAPAREIRRELADLWPNVVAMPELWAPLSKWSVGRNDALEYVLWFWWHNVIPDLWQEYIAAGDTIARTNPIAVIGFEAGVTRSGAVLQAAKRRGVTTVIYQHGSTGRIAVDDWLPYLSHASSFLVYGRETRDHLDRWKAPTANVQGVLVSVGSARLDAIRQGMTKRRVAKLRRWLQGGDRRPVVLYVPTFLGIWSKSLGELAGYQDVHYCRLQERIVRMFAEYPQVRLVYKDLPVHSVGNPIPEIIRAHVPNGTVIEKARVFELVWAVDLIIVDHVGTTLGEALLTRKPLIVYAPPAGAERYEPEIARRLLQKRAAVAEDAAEFERLVRDHLSVGSFDEVDPVNNEFLSAFGTDADDGRSAARAAIAVLEASGRAPQEERP